MSLNEIIAAKSIKKSLNIRNIIESYWAISPIMRIVYLFKFDVKGLTNKLCEKYFNAEWKDERTLNIAIGELHSMFVKGPCRLLFEYKLITRDENYAKTYVRREKTRYDNSSSHEETKEEFLKNLEKRAVEIVEDHKERTLARKEKYNYDKEFYVLDEVNYYLLCPNGHKIPIPENKSVFRFFDICEVSHDALYDTCICWMTNYEYFERVRQVDGENAYEKYVHPLKYPNSKNWDARKTAHWYDVPDYSIAQKFTKLVNNDKRCLFIKTIVEDDDTCEKKNKIINYFYDKLERGEYDKKEFKKFVKNIQKNSNDWYKEWAKA